MYKNIVYNLLIRSSWTVLYISNRVLVIGSKLKKYMYFTTKVFKETVCMLSNPLFTVVNTLKNNDKYACINGKRQFYLSV